ncbi:GntR family transcriptional regulator [Pseudonocardia sp.]|uniref:GntR family transcriptional regulator n=1 Tax=Pseudonocardia sp. TaxID=60912 RepID=UPI003D1364A0
MTTTRPGNTVEEIYLTLRKRIIEGFYVPGTRMSQSGLSKELRISRTPLREALQRLEGDGLLVSQANRGMEVAPTDVDQIEQYYAIRLLVEPPTIAAILAELDETELAKMAAELDTMEAARNRIRNFQEAHLRFHEFCIQHYPPAIADLTHSLHLKIYRHQRLYFSRPQVPDDFTRVDRMFLEAMRGGDAELARRLLEFHLIDAAMGLVSEDAPDHRYDALLVATRGLDITLDSAPDGTLTPPARIAWRRHATVDMPSLTTANLVHEAGT